MGGDLATRTGALAVVLERAVEACREARKQGLVLLLDEAQVVFDGKKRDADHPLSMLLAALNGLQSQGLSLALVLSGLPTLTTNLLVAGTYAERMFRGDTVEALTRDEASQAFLRPLQTTVIEADSALVDRVLETVGGYPYFLQLWGSELWDVAQAAGLSRFTVDLLAATDAEIYRRLDLDFYTPRVASLKPAEQDLLLAAASCPYPPLRAGDLRRASAKSAANINVLLGRLVAAGALFRQSKGAYLYTVPGFDQYLARRSAV